MGRWASMDNESAQQNALLSCLLLSAGGVSCSGSLTAIPFLPSGTIYSTSRYCLLLGALELQFQCGVCASRRPKPEVLEEQGGYTAASGSPDKNPVFIWTWHKKRSAECPFCGVQRVVPFGRCVVVWNYHPAPKNPLNNGASFGNGNVCLSGLRAKKLGRHDT